MDFSINTPALLFPAISLLLLAYGTRFNAIAARIRELREQYERQHDDKIIYQLHNLRRRIRLIRLMQAAGVSCMLGCVFCMFLMFWGRIEIAKYTFGFSLLLMLFSLYLSLREIHLSVVSLDILLSDIEKDLEDKKHY